MRAICEGGARLDDVVDITNGYRSSAIVSLFCVKKKKRAKEFSVFRSSEEKEVLKRDSLRVGHRSMNAMLHLVPGR